jgi:hypothetical protein
MIVNVCYSKVTQIWNKLCIVYCVYILIDECVLVLVWFRSGNCKTWACNCQIGLIIFLWCLNFIRRSNLGFRSWMFVRSEIGTTRAPCQCNIVLQTFGHRVLKGVWGERSYESDYTSDWPKYSLNKLNFQCIKNLKRFSLLFISVVAVDVAQNTFISAAQIYVVFIFIYTSETQFER